MTQFFRRIMSPLLVGVGSSEPQVNFGQQHAKETRDIKAREPAGRDGRSNALDRVEL
jgi:hypothetical protein